MLFPDKYRDGEVIHFLARVSEIALKQIGLRVSGCGQAGAVIEQTFGAVIDYIFL
jgi:hypothetical protein